MARCLIRRLPALAGVLCLSAIAPASDKSESIRALLRDRVDGEQRAVGIVAGVIDAGGRHVAGYGRVAQVSYRQPDGDTVFEIGSITKVFTSLLLADMIERGELSGDDPVATFLPASVRVPSRNNRQITLLDLSTQVSGLPRLPDNLHPADWHNPYADYTVGKLYHFLSGYQLTRDPGEKYEYSNLGVGLLGHVLALHAGLSYEHLVRQRILDPLGMSSTSITLSDAERRRLAVGHDRRLRPVGNWDLAALAGCGALRSTANDLLTFLAANLQLVDSPLAPAFRRLLSIRRPTGTPDLEIAMGWHVLNRFGRELVWHNGGTGGYRAFAGFLPEEKRGVVVLANTVTATDDLGRHLLDDRYPLHFGARR